MTRARKLSILIPSLLGGVILFASTFGRADDGRTVAAFWPAASDVTVPRHAQPPAPPATPPPPRDPWGTSSSHSGHHKHHRGISVSIHDGKVQIEGLREMVGAQIESVREMLRNNPSIPKDVRDRVLARLDRVNGILDRRLGNLNAADLDKLGDELGKMGDEIGKAMDGVGDDLAKLGDQWGKDFADKLNRDLSKSFQNFGPNKFKFKFKDKDKDKDVDTDNDDDNNSGNSDDDITPPTPPTPPTASQIDPDDTATRAAIADLGNLTLRPDQRAQIQQLRAATDLTVAGAKREIDQLAEHLHDALENPATSDAEITRYVDQISQQEAMIRKARILAWVKARRALDDDQRQRVVHAAAKAKHH